MRHAAAFLLTTLSLAVLTYGAFHLVASKPSPPSSPSEGATEAVRPVNAVLGNSSFRAVFDAPPSPDTPERLRLRTHLAYVEALLRARSRPSLSDAQQTRRARLLDALHAYWGNGRFPRNTEVPGRSPVFIDAKGRLCAVGALIAASAGRPLAERIDEQYHLAHVQDIDLPALDRWAERNGFTQRELAMIQPSYCGGTIGAPGPCPRRDDEDASALEVTALSASTSASILNGALLANGTPSVVGGALGVAGGAAGLTIVLRDEAHYPTASSVAGAASVVLGGWSLISALRNSGEQSSSSASAQSEWSVTPTTVSTVSGRSRPGLRASIRF